MSLSRYLQTLIEYDLATGILSKAIADRLSGEGSNG
jgi:hypothetical protein